MSIPASASMHQHENQATAALAWLADRSLPFARRLAALFIGDGQAIRECAAIGARAHTLSLPRSGGGAVFPDMSIDGSDATFQILVEVKIGSEFSEYVETDGSRISQTDLYRKLWGRMPQYGEARLRAVGTLTRHGGSTLVDPDRLRARDVSWSEVRDVLTHLLDAGIGAEVRLVAESLRTAIVEQIAVEAPDPTEIAGWLKARKPLVTGVAHKVASTLGGELRAGGSGRTYVGARLAVKDAAGGELFVRLYATPNGGGLNVAGWPDAFIASLERNADGYLDPTDAARAQQAGFLRQKDIDTFWMYRSLWPLDTIEAIAGVEAQTAFLAGEITQRIHATRLLA